MSVIIVGGGMAGATLALAISKLSQGKIKVDVVETFSPQDAHHPGFDARAIALADGTVQQLSALGLWPLLQQGATAITEVHVSDQGHVGSNLLTNEEFHVDALGYVIELHQAGQSLFKALQCAPGVTLYCPCRVECVERSQNSVCVTLDNGKRLTAQLIVAADGSHSMVAQQCGIHWQQDDYQQIAMIANVTTSQPHQGCAFERFTPQGPLALLPMSDNRSTLVWCHPIEQADTVAMWDEKTFLSQLQTAFGWRLGELTHVGKRTGYPLILKQATRHTHHRLALVGNASQTLHPIAGQGFNLGLRDVMTLAEIINNAAALEQDLGQFKVLNRYQQCRQADQQATIALTDGLVRLFANNNKLLAAGRNAGLVSFALLPQLKQHFAQRTLGWVKR